MVSIFWSPLGFPVTTVLPPRTIFTAASFYGDIIPKIVDGMSFDLANSPRQLILQMDSATPHRAPESITCLKKFRIRQIDHPPCSPNLVPSGFYLFGRLKGALVRQEFESTERLFLAVTEVTNAIGRAELESVFDP
jgi:hypothetical protein